VSKGRLDSNQ